VKLILTKEKNTDSPGSIIKRGQKYFYSDNGENIGYLTDLTDTELHQIDANIISDEIKALIPKDLNFDDIYFSTYNNRGYDKFDNRYVCRIYKKNVIINDLPYGVFYLKYNDGEVFFEEYKSQISQVNLIKNKTLVQDILNFFADKRSSGRKKKKGFLLYGDPGNGKSSEIMQLFDIAKENKFRVMIVSRRVDFEWLHNLKNLLEQDNSIFVLEEITQRTDDSGTEELLTFLDGEYSWNNSVVIATTNYPKTLPANLVDRPGRFDTFIEYGPPNKEDIKNLGAMWGFDAETSSVLAGKELSFDYVSFIMSQAKSAGITVQAALDIETKKKRLISTTFKSKIGMGL